MTLDVAMGGSTNTVLHILAIAHEAGVDFTVKDIDAISRKTPVLCKVAPNGDAHIEDVNRAGGIMGILGELDRIGLLDTSVSRVDYPSLKEALAAYDVLSPNQIADAEDIYSSAPAGLPNLVLGSQKMKYGKLDLDRAKGCIRNGVNAYSQDGGLARITSYNVCYTKLLRLVLMKMDIGCYINYVLTLFQVLKYKWKMTLAHLLPCQLVV